MRWGIDDCALAVANIDRRVTDVDTAEEWRGHYRTPRGAKRILGKGGLVKALARAARRHRWKKIKPEKARDGDRGLVATPEGAAVVIRYGKFWVGRKDYGFSALANEHVRIAYAISD